MGKNCEQRISRAHVCTPLGGSKRPFLPSQKMCRRANPHVLDCRQTRNVARAGRTRFSRLKYWCCGLAVASARSPEPRIFLRSNIRTFPCCTSNTWGSLNSRAACARAPLLAEYKTGVLNPRTRSKAAGLETSPSETFCVLALQPYQPDLRRRLRGL